MLERCPGTQFARMAWLCPTKENPHRSYARITILATGVSRHQLGAYFWGGGPLVKHDGNMVPRGLRGSVVPRGAIICRPDVERCANLKQSMCNFLVWTPASSFIDSGRWFYAPWINDYSQDFSPLYTKLYTVWSLNTVTNECFNNSSQIKLFI